MQLPRVYNMRRVGAVLILLAVSFGGYMWFFRDDDTVTTTSSMVVYEVAPGTVTTGITASGKIEAAEILDLNVYKSANRIEALTVANGTQVKEGDLLFAYDASDVAVDIAASSLSVREAKLAYDVAKEEVADPNTTIATLNNEILVLEQNLVEYQDDLRTALRNFLNKDSEVVPDPSRYSQQVTETAPVVAGVYNGTTEGIYHIRIYASGEESGYSYLLSGLENGIFPVYLGTETPLGTLGLTITFPAGGVHRNDEWVVALPNTYAPEYNTNIADYEADVMDIRERIQTDTVTLANKRTALAQAERGDTSVQRTVEVENAALAIQRAKVNLQKGIDTQDERRIIAPFSGTVEGMENVVVGATPTKDSGDPIDLGVLISDDFLATFSLSANDVDRITVGQKVLVTLTSLPDAGSLTAEVSAISSLPDSGTVPQYSIEARITGVPDGVNLRDGMLADIEIVQEEKENVLRVPTAALKYGEGKATVTVVENLSEEQQQQRARLGIIRTDTGAHTTYARTVRVGLRGGYYAEILDGLAEGELIEVSSVSTSESTAPVVGPGFGAGRNHPPEESSSSNTSSSRTATGQSGGSR